MKDLKNYDEFENYLQQQVKHHKMYASDFIWRNIQTTLHGRGRWPALPVVSIFIIAALTVGTLFIKPNDKLLNKSYNISTFPVNNTVTEKQGIISSDILEKHLSPANLTQQTIAAVSEKLNVESTVSQNTFIPSPKSISTADITIVALQKTVNMHPSGDAVDFTNNTIQKKTSSVQPTANLFFETNTNEDEKINKIVSFNPSSFILTNSSVQKKFSSISLFNSKEIWRNFPVTNKPAKQIKGSRFIYQVYATPSASYRRLVDEKNGNVQSFIPGLPVAPTYNIDVNQAVHHKPALGLEAGFAIGYKLNNQIVLKTGLQLNMRQYNIDAYGYNYEPAAVALSGSNGSDTLNTFSKYRNYSGSYPITLNNRYYEIALPLGIDWKIFSIGKFSLSAAGSVQPTYTFDRNPFIITSDFKNYADGSSLMRKWNINTSFETYFSYKMRGYNLQLGPQFRYQQLPTFSNPYTIREYLLDYGIKMGFTKAIK